MIPGSAPACYPRRCGPLVPLTENPGSGILSVPQSLLKGRNVRFAALMLLAALATIPCAIARAGDSRLVAVEFQAATDDDAGIAYLLYSTVSETLIEEGGDRMAAGEDVEMYLGSAAVDCHEKQSCLDRLAEEFDAAAMVFAVVSRRGTDIDIEFTFYSCATGRELERGEITYSAGDEGQLAGLVLGRMEDVLDKAERDEDGDFEGEDAGGAVAVVPVDGGDDDEEIDWEGDDRDDDHAIASGGYDDPTSDDEARAIEEDDSARRYDGGEVDSLDTIASDSWDEGEGDDWETAPRDDWNGDDPRRDWDEEGTRASWDEEDEEDDRDDDGGAAVLGAAGGGAERAAETGRGRYDRDAGEDAAEEDGERPAGRYSARDYLREDNRGRKSREDEDEAPEERSSRYSRYSPDEAETEEEPSDRGGRRGRGQRKPKHPEDHPQDDRGADIDPSLMETFDDEDSALFDETSRSGTGTLTYQEASEKGMGPAEYNRYASSGLTYEDWKRDRYNHKGKFHLRFGGFYALGGLDTYYSSRVVMWDPSDILETYYWQSFGFTGASGGGTFGVGFGVAPAVDLGLDVSLLAGKQWLLRQYRTPDKSESTITDVAPEDIPKGTALHFLIEPKVRVFFTPFKKVKPYGGFGIAMMFMPPFDVPEEWVQDRPTTFILGLEPTLGVQIDSPLGVGFFFEIPFTGYIASDHGVESGLEGDVRELRENEMNDPPSPVPRYMLRFQIGIQVRL